jgi:hypothetical protein
MEQHRHVRIETAPFAERYRYTRDGRSRELNIPTRDDRLSHAAQLRRDLQQATEDASQSGPAPEREGITLEFSGEPGYDLVVDQLERRRSGIELSNVRRGVDGTAATVYVPPGKVEVFFHLLDKGPQETEVGKRAPGGQKLFDSIASIRRATVRAFWTDNQPFPGDPAQKLWWEVWVRSGSTPDEHKATLERFAVALGDTDLQPGMGFIHFPERLVLLVRGSVNDWSSHPEVLNLIAELRQAKEVPTDLVDLSPAEQREWAEDAAKRVVAASATAPAVCVLDTGVWRDHPLLTESLLAADLHAVDVNWGVSDDHGHGTQMAGLALYGQELQPFIEGRDNRYLATRLESVKILPPRGANDPAHYGYVTQEGVARAERAQPLRPRTVCLATTADDRDQGYPSAWSAAIDAHSSGALDGHRRLYVVSAGNHRDIISRGYEYPTHNRELAGVEDPAQSWNAITVGACTDRVLIRDTDFSGWSPVASAGCLAPSSRTSAMWTERAWPIKPDLVMEGGNLATDGTIISPCADLELLTTAYSRSGRLFDTMRDTSAATAQVARMCAQLQAQYPDLWPETVRALLIHSARWTDQMRSEFPGPDQDTLRQLLRCYGYGIPNLGRALWSLDNQVCLVMEGELQPFQEAVQIKDGKTTKAIKANEMHIHSLPWPATELQRLLQADVRVRITLSYFIEPSPGRRGWTSKFGYQSHGLRFKLRGPYEEPTAFRQRISRAFWDDDESRPDGMNEPQDWALGSAGLPNRGSVHSNWWDTYAANLARCGEVAVYPVGGWWKQRKHLSMFNRRTRYALVISIETPEVTAQLYSAIANQIAVQSQIAT